MRILAGALELIGFAAGATAVAVIFYVVMYAQKYAHPKDNKNPDWMVVLLRLYKRQIIAYFILLAVAVAALALATYIEKHGSQPMPSSPSAFAVARFQLRGVNDRDFEPAVMVETTWQVAVIALTGAFAVGAVVGVIMGFVIGRSTKRLH